MFALILILVAIVVTAAIAFAFLSYAESGYDLRHLAADGVGWLLTCGAGFAALCYAFMAWSWIAADAKAQIINREYNTTYTREEIFFASDVIDTIREIDRKRVEVNGDLLREKADK